MERKVDGYPSDLNHTGAGEEAQLTVDLQEYDGLREFENAVLEQLPELGTSSTFCCELDFVCRDSQQKLVDPIWQTLRLQLLYGRGEPLRRES